MRALLFSVTSKVSEEDGDGDMKVLYIGYSTGNKHKFIINEFDDIESFKLKIWSRIHGGDIVEEKSIQRLNDEDFLRKFRLRLIPSGKLMDDEKCFYDYGIAKANMKGVPYEFVLYGTGLKGGMGKRVPTSVFCAIAIAIY